MKALLTNEGGYTRVFLDGEEIHRVASIEFKESVTEAPSLILEIRPEKIEVNIDGCNVEMVDILAKKKNEEGYRDFIKFLFGGLK